MLRMDPYAQDVFVGVCLRDRLPRNAKEYPYAYVCNTDPHTENGKHWIAIYVDKNGHGAYFNSYGLPPRHENFVNFLKKQCTSWIFIDKQLQELLSHACVHYCVFYLLHRCRGLCLKQLYICLDRILKITMFLFKILLLTTLLMINKRVVLFELVVLTS